jgi:hypothetical protein
VLKSIFQKIDKEKLEKVELIIRIIAIVIAAAWGIYTFHYQNATLPSFEPTSLNFKASFDKISEDDSFYFYKLLINVENNSKIPEKFISTFYNVAGYKWKFIQYNNVFDIWKNITIDGNNSYSRYFGYKDSSLQVISFGKIMRDNTVLNPGQQYFTQTIIALPKKLFLMCGLTMTGAVAKKTVDAVPNYFVDSSGYLSYSLKIINYGLFKNDSVDYTNLKDKHYDEKNGVYFTSMSNTYLVDSSAYAR